MKVNFRHSAANMGIGFVALAMIAFIGLEHAQAVLPVNAESGIAIKGYDPVAYFTEGKPVKGDSKHSPVYLR